MLAPLCARYGFNAGLWRKADQCIISALRPQEHMTDAFDRCICVLAGLHVHVHVSPVCMYMHTC